MKLKVLPQLSRPVSSPAFRAAHPMFKYEVAPTPAPIRDLFEKFSNFVVLGMGGSVLPLKGFVEAARLQTHVHFIDTVDPLRWAVAEKLPNALYCVVSKSGETLEMKALLAELITVGK